MVRLELNLEVVKQKKKYVTKDRRIERATESGDMEQFFRNVSYFIDMEYNLAKL